MQTATGWRPQLTIGSGKGAAARQRPVALSLDLHAEWDLVIQGRCNVLLVGSSSATNAMLVAIESHLRGPLRPYTPKTGVAVPQPLEGTLVLSEVARLDAKQQAQLLWWLDQFDERWQVQVVSTTSEPLFPLVETGAFLANLYYRLNVVRMDL
jgi:sigma-54-interacting transcriptional regulator